MQTLLIVAPAAAANPIADAIRAELDLTVHIAPDRRSGLAALRRQSFTLALFDEALLDLDSDASDLLYAHAGAALVLEMNFAISSVPRVLRQVRSALARRAHDETVARATASTLLQNELSASLTGILLESQLALRDATPAQEPKLRHLVELAGDLRNRLRS